MDRDDICAAFIEAIPFDPYPFQEEAILAWFEAEGGVLVTAPTGMGKTLIAEAAVFEALKSGSRMYYTTPLIALTDQKLSELQDRAEAWGFRREDVGLLTGNRKVNPNAPVLVVVAEILLNHLLSDEHDFADVTGVVMDEFHYFNDRERGVVWELSLAQLPASVRVLLLSATVGNATDFVLWLRDAHDRTVRLVHSDERKVPLQFHWVPDKILVDQLVDLVSEDDGKARTPALVFCFARDECWEMAERLKGLPLIDKATRPAIEAILDEADLSQGIGPKLRQMLIRGVGVHHAGVLPRHKAVVERLFLERLVPFVVCTETLAAGVNLPARSVVLRTLLKGKPREKRLLPSSGAHQMFGRAGRPQFDTEGHVFAMAHEDDVKIHRWKLKWEQLDTGSKDAGILKAKKQLERKKPSRRKTEQYWSEGQFRSLIEAGPAKLRSRSMIPYRFLVWLLLQGASVKDVRAFLRRRFDTEKRLVTYQQQLDAMLDNLAATGFLRRPMRESDGPESDEIELGEALPRLLRFRGVDPLFGDYLAGQLARSSHTEKMLMLESLLELPWRVARRAEVPVELEPGPLQTELLEPLMISMGITVARPEPKEDEERPFHSWDRDDEEEPPPTFPEMLVIAHEARLAVPEETRVQTKWVLGGITDVGGDTWKFIASRQFGKNEGLVMRHLLRLVLLADEFFELTADPDYETIANAAEDACAVVDSAYTSKFLEGQQAKDDVLLET